MDMNATYAEMLSVDAKERITKLRDSLSMSGDESIEDLEKLVYEIPKKSGLPEEVLKKEQRAFFKDVYNLLIGRDQGPRLGTFLWATDRKKVISLLKLF